MAENERTYRQIFDEAFEVACSRECESASYAEDVAEAYQAVAAEAVRRWLRDLPPGDEGLVEAYKEGARDSSGRAYCYHERGVAAVCEVLKHRGWIDTASLPPGDEGLAVAGRAACHAVDSARCASPWGLMNEVTRRAELAYVAAVLAVHAQRLRESVKGEPLWKTIHLSLGCMKAEKCTRCEPLADAILARLHAEGWKTPEEAAKLRSEVERLKKKLAEAAEEHEKDLEANDELGAKLTQAETELLKKEPALDGLNIHMWRIIALNAELRERQVRHEKADLEQQIEKLLTPRRI